VRRILLFSVAVVIAMLVSSELSLSLPLFGVGPDLVILVVASFAIGERPRQAAMAGFAAGFFRDMLLSTPAGLSAFAYAVVAYIVSMLGVPRGVGPVVGTFAGATFVSQLIFGLGAIMLGQQINSSSLPRMLIVTTAYNALVSPLLMPLLRRVVRAETSPIGSMD
jgi:rod shape-determining protein MreD